MPAKAQWLLRIPEILEVLYATDTPWLDRPSLERLFCLRRRRAIDLMHAFGGFQTGRTFLVDRQNVIQALEAVAGGEEFQWERRRRVRVAEEITEARRYIQAARVTISAPPGSGLLPDGVQVADKQLIVDFSDSQDLLGKLYGLAQSAAADYERFQGFFG